jgi:hypothetical protein
VAFVCVRRQQQAIDIGEVRKIGSGELAPPCVESIEMRQLSETDPRRSPAG